MNSTDERLPVLPPIVGVLENIRSMWNVGSMFRSADGAGLERILLCGFTAHPPRVEISRTALGAEDHMAWEYWSQASEAVAALREQGYTVLGLECNGQSLELDDRARQQPFDGPLAFVVGHEIEGVSTPVLELCDATVHLPMRGMKGSLNVAVAFGIAAYSLRRLSSGA